MSSSPSVNLLLSLLISGLIAVPASLAADKNVKQQQLDNVLRKIEKLKLVIDTKEDSKSQYIKQLKFIERKIGELNRKIRGLGGEIKTKQSELTELGGTRQQQQRQLERENNSLAEQVYAAYTLGQQEKVKLLFSQRDPQTLQRNLIYYQYFSNARVNLINAVQTNIDRIVATENLIRQARKDLESHQLSLQKEKQRLGKDRGKRKKIVASLDQQLQRQGGNLTRLEDEATQLQNLIDSIQEFFEVAPENDISRQTFAQMKGKLAWPARGKVKKLFGRVKPLSNLRWQGVMIEAASGNHVKAVSHGRIAFADWLRGLGNLIIIDHGNSYLSLYGHNESLFKTAGEWVETGEVISSIGNSGGQKESALYFEIRKKGRPQNPTGWCKAGNRFASG